MSIVLGANLHAMTFVATDGRMTSEYEGIDAESTFDVGGKLLPIRGGWAAWGNHHERGYGAILRQIANLKESSGPNDFERALRGGWEGGMEPDAGHFLVGAVGNQGPALRHYLLNGAFKDLPADQVHHFAPHGNGASEAARNAVASSFGGVVTSQYDTLRACGSTIHQVAEASPYVSDEAYVGMVVTRPDGVQVRAYLREDAGELAGMSDQEVDAAITVG